MSNRPLPTPSSSLFLFFQSVVESELFDGSHVSLDRDGRGTLTVNIGPDWLETSAVRFLVNLASEQELSLVLTKEGVRVSEQSDEMVRAVTVGNLLDALKAFCDEKEATA